MASLAEVHCSLNILASQFSSTTRNLVPRFKRGSKGEGIWSRNSNESSRSWLLFLKRPIHNLEVFISLLQVIMMKSASFLPELHRTYERIKGLGEQTSARLTNLLITSGKVAEINSRIETYENIESKVRRYPGKFQVGRQSFDA